LVHSASDAIQQLTSIQQEIERITRYVDPAVAQPNLDARLRELTVELARLRTLAAPVLQQRADFVRRDGAQLAGSRGGARGLPALKDPGATPELEVLADLRMPSVPTSLGRLFAVDGTALISTRIRNNGDRPRTVCVSTSIEGFTAHARETVVCPPGEQQLVDQFPTFFPEAVARLDEFCVATVALEVINLETGVPIVRRTLPIRLLARQTAVLYQLDPQTGSYRDLRHTLGAWVTPNSRQILELLRVAADYSSLKAMRGYQVDEAGILEHVRAIFEALKAAQIVYVNSVDAFGGVEGQFLQRVRTPSESLASKSANCIDGTVLMASLLEATGIEAAIVLVPGHAYLGWLKRKPNRDEGQPPEITQPDAHLSHWDSLETTLVGVGTFEQAREHAQQATLRFKQADLLTILPVAALRQRHVSPLE
jgi:hypothetical protein